MSKAKLGNPSRLNLNSHQNRPLVDDFGTRLGTLHPNFLTCIWSPSHLHKPPFIRCSYFQMVSTETDPSAFGIFSCKVVKAVVITNFTETSLHRTPEELNENGFAMEFWQKYAQMCSRFDHFLYK